MIVFYISGHGFGHAARSVELIRALGEEQPALPITIRTTAPAWLFDGVPGVSYERFEADVGIVQPDSVSVDVAATALRAAEFYRDFDRRVDTEAAWLRTAGVSLVLSDAPPLAHAAAMRAGLPSVLVSNFTWDWIYGGSQGFDQTAPGVVDIIRDAYRHCTLALRLPMHGGFTSITRIVDIPWIARQSMRSREETRDIMRIPSDRPFVLVSFGAYGVDVPFEAIARQEGLTILSSRTAPPPPIVYQDLVAAADVVVSKPGYGIVSECVANEAPLLYTSRGEFVEYDVFVEQMPRVLRCRFMPQDDLRSGRWRRHVDALLAQGRPPDHPRVDGARVAAELVRRTTRL